MKPTYRNPLLRNFVLAATTLLGLAAISHHALPTSSGTPMVMPPPPSAAPATGAPPLGATAPPPAPSAPGRITIAPVSPPPPASSHSTRTSPPTASTSRSTATKSAAPAPTPSPSAAARSPVQQGQAMKSPPCSPGPSFSTQRQAASPTATSFFIKANNTGLTSVELNASGTTPANANMLIDDAGAFGPGGGTANPRVKLTTGILNIGALTTEAIGSATANGSGGGLNLNAWATKLGGGTIRSRAGANTWNGPTTLTANSGLMTRGAERRQPHFLQHRHHRSRLVHAHLQLRPRSRRNQTPRQHHRHRQNRHRQFQRRRLRSMRRATPSSAAPMTTPAAPM